MPYKSIAQERYFNANVGKKKGLTPEVVNEFNKESKGMKLPKKKGNDLAKALGKK